MDITNIFNDLYLGKIDSKAFEGKNFFIPRRWPIEGKRNFYTFNPGNKELLNLRVRLENTSESCGYVSAEFGEANIAMTDGTIRKFNNALEISNLENQNFLMPDSKIGDFIYDESGLFVGVIAAGGNGKVACIAALAWALANNLKTLAHENP